MVAEKSNVVLIASDHAAFDEKAALKIFLLKQNYTVIDLGTDSKESCHYPKYAKKLCEYLLSHQQSEKNIRGILLCGSGIGVSMAANRYSGIRAARCVSVNDAKLSREHNDANVLCLGSRINSVAEMEKIIDVWLETAFEGGRHAMRLKMF